MQKILFKMAADKALTGIYIRRMLLCRNSVLSTSALSSYDLHTAVACSAMHTAQQSGNTDHANDRLSSDKFCLTVTEQVQVLTDI